MAKVSSSVSASGWSSVVTRVAWKPGLVDFTVLIGAGEWGVVSTGGDRGVVLHRSGSRGVVSL